MRAIPVADGILESELFGLPFGKLLQSSVPTVPAVVLLVLQMPWIIYLPPFILGAVTSVYLFYSTPPGQMPSDYLYSWVKRMFRPDTRYKSPQDTESEPVRIQDGGKTIEREPPTSPLDESGGSDGGLFSANTIDDVPIEGIHDNGVIETERAFTQLIDIRPTVWSHQPEHQKESILGAYASYLHTVDHPVQWVTYPVPLDIGGYQEQLKDAHRNAREDESDVIAYGRDYHAGFVDELTADTELRERKFILAISSLKTDTEYEEVGGIQSFLPNSIAIGVNDEEADQHLRQLRDRVSTARSTLPQCGFSDVSVLDNREDVLRVLQLYYQEKETGSAPTGLTTYSGTSDIPHVDLDGAHSASDCDSTLNQDIRRESRPNPSAETDNHEE